jgi:hypothetical protein
VVWFNFQEQTLKPGQVMIGHLDMAADMDLPTQAGRHTVAMHCASAYRVQMLTPAEANAFDGLRMDANFFQRRSAELMEELSTRHWPYLLHDDATLSGAARLLRQDALVAQVRSRLAGWIDKSPQEVAGKGFPNELCDALVAAGSAEDIALFRRLLNRHPQEASRLTYRAAPLARRWGLAAAKTLVLELAANDGTDPNGEGKVPHEDGTVPHGEAAVADAMVLEMALALGLEPSQFGLAKSDAGRWSYDGDEARAKGLASFRLWVEEQARRQPATASGTKPIRADRQPATHPTPR